MPDSRCPFVTAWLPNSECLTGMVCLFETECIPGRKWLFLIRGQSQWTFYTSPLRERMLISLNKPLTKVFFSASVLRTGPGWCIRYCRERQCSVADRSWMHKEAMYCAVKSWFCIDKRAAACCGLVMYCISQLCSTRLWAHIEWTNVTGSVTDGP